MATRPIHPEVQARADQLLREGLPDNISPESRKWTADKLGELNAKALQEKVDRRVDACSDLLQKERLTEAEVQVLRSNLQRLAFYPTIHADLHEKVEKCFPILL
ncbi:MAG: hypothetical protein P0S96_04620 [Simkaniaceae bacterium]|nr:hypothetical protein [Candidatus Sacchlamyda saccharinae]